VVEGTGKIMKTYGTMIIFGSQAKNLNNNNRFQKFEADIGSHA
jgi:hypothetical protein